MAMIAVTTALVAFLAYMAILVTDEYPSTVEEQKVHLEIDYPEYEVIVVNDGSKDGTLLARPTTGLRSNSSPDYSRSRPWRPGEPCWPAKAARSSTSRAAPRPSASERYGLTAM